VPKVYAIQASSSNQSVWIHLSIVINVVKRLDESVQVLFFDITNKPNLNIVFNGVNLCVIDAGFRNQLIPVSLRLDFHWAIDNSFAFKWLGAISHEDNCMMLALDAILRGALALVRDDRPVY
jgi:hypothetical protein